MYYRSDAFIVDDEQQDVFEDDDDDNDSFSIPAQPVLDEQQTS
jgi:hypothetical protein